MRERIRAAIVRGLEALQRNPGRTIGILSIVLIGPLTATLEAWLAIHFPGVHVEESVIEKVMAATVLGAIAYGITELHSDHQAKQGDLDRANQVTVAAIAAAPNTTKANTAITELVTGAPTGEGGPPASGAVGPT